MLSPAGEEDHEALVAAKQRLEEERAQLDKLEAVMNPAEDPRRPGFIPLIEAIPPKGANERILYGIFLLLFVLSSQTSRSTQNAFNFREHIMKRTHVGQFESIDHVKQYSAWWQLAVLDGLRPWFANQEGTSAKVMLLGVPRVRQVRAVLTTKGSASQRVVPFMRAARVENRNDDFTGLGVTSDRPFADHGPSCNLSSSCPGCGRYTHRAALKAEVLDPFSEGEAFSVGTMRFPGDGFVLNASAQMLAQNGWEPACWMDSATLAVVHDFTLYNPNTFEIGIVRLKLALLPAGNVRSDAEVNVVRPFMRHENKFTLGLEVLFYLMLLYFVFVEELRFLLSLSRECTIIVPMTLMVCTLQRQMLQIRRTFARTNLTFDPRHPLQREYYLGSAFSTDELFDGEKYHDNARCSIGYIRMQTVSLATKIYEARQRGEEENEDLKRRWMDLKDRLQAMEVCGALTRHLYMAVVWDCCAAEDVPTLTWSDANTHTSASNYKDFLRVLLCHDRCKFTRLSDVDWINMAFRLASALELKYALMDQSDILNQALLAFWRNNREQFEALPKEWVPAAAKSQPGQGTDPGTDNPLRAQQDDTADGGEQEQEQGPSKDVPPELLRYHLKMFDRLERREGFLRLTDNLITLSKCVEHAKELQLSWQTGSYSSTQLRLIYLRIIKQFNFVGFDCSALKSEIAALPHQGFNANDSTMAGVYAGKFDVVTDEIENFAHIAADSDMPWAGSPRFMEEALTHRQAQSGQKTPDNFASRKTKFFDHASLLDSAPDMDVYINSQSGTIEFPTSSVCAPWTWMRRRVRWIGMVVGFYFTDVWNIADTVNYTMLLLTLILRMLQWHQESVLEDHLENLQARGTMATDDGVYTYCRVLHASNTLVTSMQAVNAIILWVKANKYIISVPQLGFLINVLAAASGPVFLFVIVGMLPLMGFAQAFHGMLGVSAASHSSFGASMNSNLLMLCGVIDPAVMTESGTWMMGLYWVFMITMYFMIVNVFIAIVSSAYEKVVSGDEEVTDAGVFYQKVAFGVKSAFTSAHGAGADAISKAQRTGDDERPPQDAGIVPGSREVLKGQASLQAIRGHTHNEVHRGGAEAPDEDTFWELCGNLLDDRYKAASFQFMGPRGEWIEYPEDVSAAIKAAHDDPLIHQVVLKVPHALLTPELIGGADVDGKEDNVLISFFEEESDFWVHTETTSGRERKVRMTPALAESDTAAMLAAIQTAMAEIEELQLDKSKT